MLDLGHQCLVSSTRNPSRESPADCHQEEEANSAQKLKVDDACQHGKAGGQSGDEEGKNPEPALRHQCQAADKSPRNFRTAVTLLAAAKSSSKTNGLKMDIASVGIGWFARGDQACRRARRRKGSAFRRASERHALGAGRP